MCDGTRNVKQYRYRYFVRNQIFPNFSDTGSETFYIKFYLYQFRDFFYPVPTFFNTGSDNTYTVPVPIINLLNSLILATKISSSTEFFRYRGRDIFPTPVPKLFSDTGSVTFFWYQIFLIPVPRFFSGTNFSGDRFRYHQKN